MWGAAAYRFGGGAYQGTLLNCVLSSNTASHYGGGVYGGALENCTIGDNSAKNGAGAYLEILNNCKLIGNAASISGGGAANGVLNNCAILFNTADTNGGGASGSTLANCTVYGNAKGGVQGGTARNTISFGNETYEMNGVTASFCETNDPLFVSAAAGNLRLQSNSPCVNTGSNAYAPTNATPFDLDGNPRITEFIVDKGAYEFKRDEFFELFTSAGPHGTIVPSGVIQTTRGANVSFLLQPDEGYRVADVTTNGSSIGAVTDFTWHDVVAPGTVHVTFAETMIVQTAYVSASSGKDSNKGTNWVTAKATIQAAVDIVVSGGTVWVSNGVYNVGGRVMPGSGLTNRVAIPRPILVRSINGAETTAIEGRGPAGNSAIRGVYLGSNATLIGFTITNGYTRKVMGDPIRDWSGGGILAEEGARIERCIVAGNAAEAYGGGLYGGRCENSVVYVNRAFIGGGCAMATLLHGTVMHNTAGDQAGNVYQCLSRNSILFAGVPDNMAGGAASYCCVAPDPGGEGNVTNEPCLMNSTAGDFRVKCISACVDGGAPLGVQIDFSGAPRPQPRHYGEAAGYDIGAYEFYPAARFVWTNGNARAPYSKWTDAARSIQSAVDVAGDGDLIMVMDGTYQPDTCIRITNTIRLTSMNGAGAAILILAARAEDSGWEEGMRSGLRRQGR